MMTVADVPCVMEEFMISPALRALLDRIRLKEAPKGYGQIYSGAKGAPKDPDVSKMTLNRVLELQHRMIKNGSASSAAGGYQFIRKTLVATISQMRLTGAEIWTPALQDQMAIHLMKGRGLEMYTSGRMSRDDFANNLAKEWASLPVVTRIMGQKRMVNPGETFYAGDGLNKAHHKPETIIALVNALIVPVVPKPPQMPVDAPGLGTAPRDPEVMKVPVPPQPVPPVAVAKVSWWRRFLTWMQA